MIISWVVAIIPYLKLSLVLFAKLLRQVAHLGRTTPCNALRATAVVPSRLRGPMLFPTGAISELWPPAVPAARVSNRSPAPSPTVRFALFWLSACARASLECRESRPWPIQVHALSLSSNKPLCVMQTEHERAAKLSRFYVHLLPTQAMRKNLGGNSKKGEDHDWSSPFFVDKPRNTLVFLR